MPRRRRHRGGEAGARGRRAPLPEGRPGARAGDRLLRRGSLGGQSVPLGASMALRGATALHYAALEDRGSIAELLLQHNADTEAKKMTDGPGA